jgi:hypothetical protein
MKKKKNEVGLEVNTQRTKYMLLSHHEPTGQNHYIKVANKSHENVEKFKYVGMTVNKSELHSRGN